jgi:xanthine dehydrogenase accessory factor
MDRVEIFRFLAAKSAIGPVALVTVTRVSGSSMRNPGSHLAVAADGEWRGSLSGGCVEAAVVAEALEAICDGTPREVRFGQGSRYIDIRLPCGGSLDVLIVPIGDPTPGAQASVLLDAREPFVVVLPLANGRVEIARGAVDWRTRRTADSFAVAHTPPLEVLIVGHGASVEALDRQARALGAVTRAITPDREIAARLAAAGVAVTIVKTPRDIDPLTADRWTAIAFVFHEHDWEVALIARALATPAFYIGAMGSRAAHAQRRDALMEHGVPLERIAVLRAPIGLIPSSRDPQVLALSTLAEIVRDFGAAIERTDLDES